MQRILICLALFAILAGCQRPWYRRSADRETYAVEREHENEARWPVANTCITPPAGSRLFDPFNPDFPPIPPDDPAAHFYMHHPDGQRAPRTYHRDGDAPWIEDPSWRDTLPLDKDGNLVLSPDKAVELGLLHSRQYQQQLENLYNVALTLTLNRFEFAMHWFGTNNTTYTTFGAGDTSLRTLQTNSDLGFTRNLASGGQLLVDFANSFVFTFAGTNHTTTTSNFNATLIQPLLRNAGRRIRLEALTQAERNLLYAVRSFARFREQFYVNLTNVNGYLGLLSQVQNLRNLESNVKSLEENLKLYEALYALGKVSTVNVDQVFTDYQAGLLRLVTAKSDLESALDTYKASLGLPPDIPVKLDDSMLQPFQLVAPKLEALQDELEKFSTAYRELEQAPPLSGLREGFTGLKGFHRRLFEQMEEVEGELKRLQVGAGKEGEAALKREQATRASLASEMLDFREKMFELAKDLEGDAARVAEATRDVDWKGLQKKTSQLIALATQLYVVQTQVRVYLIQLEPITYTLAEASALARDNRLDLMNQRAEVVDAWRQIEVTASALKAGLDLKVNANLATPIGGNKAFDFRAESSQYSVGLAFDSPLNRLAERNTYRASLITYQQARRAFMALDDQIQSAVRLDLRQLETQRANFSIARQTLVAAARSVESTRESLTQKEIGATSTLDILQAFTTLLNAKSALIASWIGYQSTRAQLLLDMDALRLTPEGLPEHETVHPTSPARLGTPIVAAP